MRTRWVRIFIVTALLTAACASPANPTGNASSASRIDTLTPNPVSPTAPPSIHYLAMVTLRGSNVIVVRDLTDIAQAKTIGAFRPVPAQLGSGAPSDQFLTATEVSYVGDKTDDYFGLPTGLFRAPVSGSPGTEI